MRLSILLATTTDRRAMFHDLYAELQKQIKGLPVELKVIEDRKQISIGKKRDNLLKMATGDYIVFFDSDDMPYPDYVESILKALESNPDCVGFKIHMTTNGEKPQTCCHSLRYKKWAERKDGYDYVRNCTHFNPVKRELALQVGFEDIRFGEDRIYSDKITQLCRREVFIDKKLFHYRYSTKVNHYKKYGIKQ